jgi:dienelactone hydrolase
LATTALVLASLVCHSWSEPVISLADGRTGKIEFATLSLSANDFWNGVKNGPAVNISGQLTVPERGGRVPAIIITHGAGGISASEETWAGELRSQGLAVFVVDSFTARGIKQSPSESELSRVGQVYDVYQALMLLATHPRIDRERIGLMGMSRGGGLTVAAAMVRSLKAQIPNGPEFFAYLAIYPTLIRTLEYGMLASRPIRIFSGTADEVNSIAMLRAFTEQQRAAGAEIKLFEYGGAHHAFDNPRIGRPLVVKGLVEGATVQFTIAYDARAHARMKQDMKDTLHDLFGKGAAKGTE